jgi:cation/acetate symporter
MRVSRIATVCLGIVAIALGILFEGQNIAFLVGLTFGIAASANFPVLIMAMYWEGLTTRGALYGGLTGLISALGLVIGSPSVWVGVLGHAQAIFPYDQPALFSMPLAFLVIVVVSRLDRSERADRERAAYADQFVRAQTGLGAAMASSH